MFREEQHDNVLVLYLQNGKVNALDLDFLLAIKEKVVQLKSSSHEAIVLTGAGSCFSAGVDLKALLNGGTTYINKFLPALNDALECLVRFPKPVIAAINGHAVAGGCIIACSCDYRIMVDTKASMGIAELAVGVPFPAVPFEIMRNAVSPNHFQELLYSGASQSPQEAFRMGLVHQLCQEEELLPKAIERAKNYANIPPSVFSISKIQFFQSLSDKLEKHRLETDTRASQLWTSVQVMQSISDYMGKIQKK